LAVLLLFVGLIMVYFLRQAFDSTDASRIDQLPQDHDSFEENSSQHDRRA